MLRHLRISRSLQQVMTIILTISFVVMFNHYFASPSICQYNNDTKDASAVQRLPKTEKSEGIIYIP